jgi:hypothetical protein
MQQKLLSVICCEFWQQFVCVFTLKYGKIWAAVFLQNLGSILPAFADWDPISLALCTCIRLV